MTTAFRSLSLSQDLLQVVAELGYESMTPIQAQSIPVLLQGRDLIGQSKTGSGKTAAFTLPILEKLDLQNKNLHALILCPTRELCTQVAREVRKLGRKHPGLKVVIVSGGQPIAPQIHTLKTGAHIVVGTPGRVMDHLNRKTLDLRRIQCLVLDEADRMLDMGFEEDMQAILAVTPKTRQTVLFSATFPSSIESISRQFQKNPAKVTIQESESNLTTIKQVFYKIDSESKDNAVLWILQQYKPESAIVFCNLKRTTTDLAKFLNDSGVSAAALNGDLEQADRDRVMAKFRNQSTRILIATDVAARGIDINDLDLVINFDLPQADVYVHRIGRTGRAGKRGLAISISTPKELGKIKHLEKETGFTIDSKSVGENLGAETKVSLNQYEAKMQTLYIAGGRKEKMRPGDILGALTSPEVGLLGDEIGKIEIHDHFSYVAVASAKLSKALRGLQEGRIKGRRFTVRPVR